MRDVVIRPLKRANYRVSAYEHPEQLLSHTDRINTPFQLLITDVVMPKMSGLELVARLREGGVLTPTLFISGYTGDSSPLESPEAAGDMLLMKPFDRTQLLAAVNAILSKGAESG